MATSNSKPNSLDESILRRLDQLEAACPSGPVANIADPLSLIPSAPVTNSIPFVNIASAAHVEPPAQRTFLDEAAADISHTASHRISCKDGDVWLSGNTLLCTCPDCSAPMSVRTWLRLADCWRCSSSVALSEEQIQAVNRLIDLAPTPQPRSVPQPRRQQTPKELPPPPPPPIDQPRALTADEREMEHLSRGSFAARLVRNGFKLTPAWMVSLILHFIAILILALIILSDRTVDSTAITLSSFLSPEIREGGVVRMSDPDKMLADDLPLPNDMDVADEELRKVLKKANQDAKALQVDPQPLAQLPDIKRVRENITTERGPLMSFAARDPRVRAEIVRKEGGTTITEAAVARGLRWIASVQNHDGGWSLGEYHRHKSKNNPSDIMGTSLALLPMLGAGQTHEYGLYKENVAAGLAWLLEHQLPNGDLRAGYDRQAGMYAHGQAAIVLCEALAVTGDEKFREPAQRAIQFIESAQHGRGGWRYRPGQEGDLSVFGWQMMALQSARTPGADLVVDDATLKLADYFLDRVTVSARFSKRRNSSLPKGSAYCYMRGKSATAAMTAEAILCRMYLGWKKDDPRLSQSVKWLIEDHFPSARSRNLYYWYYGTQVMHHYGGQPWKKWNDKMRELLISSQESRGSAAGSWDPDDYEWGSKGGRIYTTSLAVCTLEVYYRHLPIFKQIELSR